jgi:hypothetical protein
LNGKHYSGLWYLKWLFFMTRPFFSRKMFDLVTLTLMFDLFIDDLTLFIYFEWWVKRIFYFTWVFFVTFKTRPFSGYQKFNLVTLTLVFDLLNKTFTLAISFEWYVPGLWYFTIVLLVTIHFCGYRFDFVTLTLVFDLLKL